MEAINIINYIIIVLSQIIRFLGLAVLGLGLGWLVLELFKRLQPWQAQIALFLGLAGLVIAMVVFTGWGALGAFSAGLGVALLVWGMPRKDKPEEKKK
jgi:NhaP-type Na+/H+ or K+/H+ antiporter